MTYEEAFSYIGQIETYGSKYGTETEKELLRRLGHPEERIMAIHIAGTNGKGSICAFLEQIFRHAGYRVGRYISPAVTTYLERFQIDGQLMREEEFADVIGRIRPVCEAMKEGTGMEPTAFEIETAVAFLYFEEMTVDVALIETGMGGRLDATNVMDHPICTVLASISRDHMKFLGDTLPEILNEKMGILREQTPCAAYPMQEELKEVWEKTCVGMKIPHRMADLSKLLILSETLDGSAFRYDGDLYELSVPGVYQIYNSITAIEVCRMVGGRFHLTQEDLYAGLKHTVWAGRFQKISEHPLFMIDGAHNEGGWKSLRQNIETYFPDQPIILICGVLADKEYRKMADILAPFASCVITVTPENPRALDKETLAECFLRYSVPAQAAASLDEAERMAKACATRMEDPVILACGSLSFLGKWIV